LRNVGPIQVSVQAVPFGGQIETLPLFIEARVPLGESVCSRSFPGSLIWQTYGRASCDPDSLWSRSPLIDISPLTPLGELYYLQIEGFLTVGPDSTLSGWASSPALACVEVKSFPSATLPGSWTLVKSLFH
jgi:hypothetical protein